MPIYHCQMKFAASPFGWTEALYRLEQKPQVALDKIIDLAVARYSILGSGASLYRVRVSQVGFPRASIAALVSGTTQSTIAYTALEGADINLMAGSRGLYWRNYFLRGLPVNSLTNASGRWDWAPQWAGKVRAWLNKLVSGGWLMQAWGRAGPRFPLTGIFGLPGEIPDVDVPEPPDFGPNLIPGVVCASVQGLPVIPPADPTTNAAPSLRIGGVKWSDPLGPNDPPVNGEFSPLAVNQNVVQYWGDVPSVGSYVSGGYLQLRPQLFPPINDWRLVKHAVHPTGPAPKEAMKAGDLPSREQQLAAIGGFLAPNPKSQVQTLTQAFQGLAVPQPAPTPPQPPVPPRPPIYTTWANAQHVLLSIQNDLNLDVPPVDYKPLGLYQVLNRPNTWAILCSGTFAGQNASDTNVFSAIALGTAHMTTFVNRLLSVVGSDLVPKPAEVYLFGLSQGGMVCEWGGCYLEHDFSPDIIVKQVVTFGAPMVNPFFRRSFPIYRFMVGSDNVPGMGPVALLQGALGYPAYTIIRPDPIWPRFPGCHTHMFLNPGLQQYDILGQPISDDPPIFQVGAPQVFAVPLGG